MSMFNKLFNKKGNDSASSIENLYDVCKDIEMMNRIANRFVDCSAYLSKEDKIVAAAKAITDLNSVHSLAIKIIESCTVYYINSDKDYLNIINKCYSDNTKLVFEQLG